jgi:hypothetical protein
MAFRKAFIKTDPLYYAMGPVDVKNFTFKGLEQKRACSNTVDGVGRLDGNPFSTIFIASGGLSFLADFAPNCLQMLLNNLQMGGRIVFAKHTDDGPRSKFVSLQSGKMFQGAQWDKVKTQVVSVPADGLYIVLKKIANES